MRSRMIPIVKLMYWFFIIDNILDEPSEMGTDTESADVLLARVVDVMEGREESESRTKLNVCVKKQKTIAIIVDTAREWWNEMRALGMSCRLQARMVKSMTEYLNAHRFLIIHRSSSPQAVLDMENYLHYRGMAGGWWPCLVAMEFGLDLHLEEEVLSHPYIRALQRSTAWHVYWVNDVASFKKELLEDNIQCNLIPVLYVKRVIETEARRSKTGIELQTVVNEATSIIREEDANWVRLVSDIRSCEMLMPTGNEQPCLRRRQDLETYMEAMGHWRSGNLYYHLASERYGICATIDGYVQAPDFRANYVVRLQN
ncbi:hypothetical protein KP509_06G033500 [Ceratopteris richardii]|nr:hypothetical protein KP509_06G033500 [Ceratopteris richardii]